MKRLLLLALALLALPATAQVPEGYAPIGRIKPRSTHEITSSNWILGCETLDRGMADYDQYKAYLAPLGAKRIRLQAGWATTEKVKGVYDWEWLDHIIDDAVSRRIAPWLQTSYGNPIYPGGGGINLSAGIPSSEEALAAWDRWVEAMVGRYADRVTEWEVWNEPNFGDNTVNSPTAVADLNVRTAAIIKRLQPAARVSGLSMGHIDLDWAEAFFARIHSKGMLHLFDNMSYHDYVYNPDSNYWRVRELRRVLDRYAPHVKLRQGENGAPSMGGAGRGALGDYEWSELTQAKWITRRMLGDLGHDLESSILGIIDMNYGPGAPITRLNVKGLIESDHTRRAIRPKTAYYAVQHVTAVFDDSLQRIARVRHTYNANAPVETGEVKYHPGTDRGVAVFGYASRANGRHLFTVWMDEHVPVDDYPTRHLRFTLIGAAIDEPVYVDIVSGAVHAIPKKLWRRDGNKLIVEDLPVHDAPVLLADRSLIALR